VIRRREKKEGLVPRDRWGPAWASPVSVLSDMDRIFDDFRTEWENTFLMPRGFADEAIRQPLIDLADEEKQFVIRAEVPGIRKEDLSIDVTEDGIEISGETSSEANEEGKGYLKRERRYAKFYRSLPLPDKIVADKAIADLKDGILTVKLPKAAPPEKKSRKLQVK